MDLPEEMDIDLDLNLPPPIEAIEISIPKSVNIDFEQASIAWRRNKISNGKGSFTYIKRPPKACTKLTYQGNICGKINCIDKHGCYTFVRNEMRKRNVRRHRFLFGKPRSYCKNYQKDSTPEKMTNIIIID